MHGWNIPVEVFSFPVDFFWDFFKPSTVDRSIEGFVVSPTTAGSKLKLVRQSCSKGFPKENTVELVRVGDS